MILALSLLVLLAAAAVVSLVSVREKRALGEGAGQLEAMIRMARAESATRGRRLQLQFDGANAPRVLWEPDPLAAPGKFEDYAGCLWADQFDAQTVDVVRCRLTGDSAAAEPAATREPAEGDGEGPLDPITFYPDGRTDSAVIELRLADEADTRIAVITLDGTHGLLSTKVLTQSQREELEPADE
jgi:Tfp pilus assembly protein FimT